MNTITESHMASLEGLPPLPKSLSGFNMMDHQAEFIASPSPSLSCTGAAHNASTLPYRALGTTSTRANSTLPSSHILRNMTPPVEVLQHVYPRVRKPIGLDAQLAILRKEMFGLRQLDLSLLSQLWSLNEAMQEFRQLLQEQEDTAALSPPSPSSADEGEEFYSPLPARYHGVMPSGVLSLSSVPEQYHLSSSSSQSSIEYGNV